MGQNIYGVDIGTSNFKMCCKDKDKIINCLLYTSDAADE